MACRLTQSNAVDLTKGSCVPFVKTTTGVAQRCAKVLERSLKFVFVAISK